MDKISYTKRTAEDLDLLVFDICQIKGLKSVGYGFRRSVTL